jgi:PST family polysaccharide transporter
VKVRRKGVINNLNKKIVTATKWSSVTEIAAKLVAPVTTMLLARILTPDAFGVLVTVMMVISFAEIFTDAGFQKFLIQHEFESDEELYQSTNVAFWTNLIFSLLIWGLIIIFSQPIAELVGSPNESSEIAVAGCCIPLAAFSSIQMALYKRGFDFKTLFYVRIVGVLIPLFVTVPLALYFRNCWALILGVIAQNFSNALLLTLKSPWKPNRFYSFAKLKEMFSFSMWSMIESVTVWLTLNMDIFFIGRLLSPYYLGLYRTSINTVGQVNSVITSATTPVLYSSLSRLQEEGELFKNLFFKFQKTVALLVFPLGAMIYIFRDYVTYLLLGSQWGEAAYFVGLWGVSSAIVIVFSNFCCDVYRAKGKPKLIFYVHAVYNIVWVFMLYFSGDKGFVFYFELRT